VDFHAGNTDLRGCVRSIARRAHRGANRNTSKVRQRYSGLCGSRPAPAHCRAALAPLRLSHVLVAARPVSLVSLWLGTLGVLVWRRRRSSLELL